MIGTSDGEQYEDSFQHYIAAEMPLEGSEKAVGEFKSPDPTLPSLKPPVPSNYDKLPMSDNVDDRRREISDMAKNAKSMSDLLDQIEAMGKDSPDASAWYRSVIKESDVTDPLSRKAGILDLIDQMRKLNQTK